MELNEIIDVDQIKCRIFDPNTTLQQMRYDVRKFVCWGATKFTVYGRKNNVHALRFYVTGMKHKGHVYIALNGADLYDIYYTTLKGKILNKDTDVYCDQLTDIIDERIEKIEDYRF